MNNENLPPIDDQQDPEEEADHLAFLPADHALLQRLQAAMTKQLTDEHERVDLELIESEDKLKKIERQKEDIGVQLYGVQQQLAENQMTYEQTKENYNLVQRLRLEAEQKLTNLNEVYSIKKREIEELRKKYIKAQDELSKLNRTLKQIANYNVQMKSEIDVTRQTTYRAEENVMNLEKMKKKQDFLIDMMNEEIKRLTEQKTILTAQLISQKEETEQAKQILKEAHLEMQKIIASKKNLLERWQKALFNMHRRDNALQAIKEALKQQQEMNIQIGTELTGIEHEIRKENEVAEKLAANNQKLLHDKHLLEIERKKLEHKKVKLQAKYDLLSKSLQTTETETKKVEIEKKNIEDQMAQIEANIMKLHTETKKNIEKLIHNLSEQKTIEKTAANLQKQAHLIAAEIEDKEVELENLMNEAARVQIDILNTKSQNELLDNKKKEVIKEKEEKEITVATYEVQIRQGHDLNEKKQHEVGRLNKIHDELLSNTSEVNRGPLEARKHNLVRQTEEKTNQCKTMEGDWIKKETLLVKHNDKLMTMEDHLSELKTKQTILEQKKLRLNQTYNQHQKEIKDIQNMLNYQQTEMRKLNDGLAENADMKHKLENENINIESEFIEKLKELEKDSVRLEVEIDRLKEEKAELLAEIVESERQILLWDRKIKLEKEMQETLNPEVGQKELQELKKEIHRMELRLEDLRKKQENVIIEMERAVYKRESIQLKYDNKGKEKKETKVSKAGNDYSQIKKQIVQLKQTLNQSTINSKQIDSAIKEKQNEINNLNNEIEEINARFANLERDVTDLNMAAVQGKLEKNVGVFKISALQTEAKKYEEILANNAKLAFPELQLRNKLKEVSTNNKSIKEALEKIAAEQPHYSNLMHTVLEII